MSNFFEIDDVIPFSKRHEGETIRQIIRYDSGYLKDLFVKDERVVFSEKCYSELKRLTKGFKDNWEKPPMKTGNFFQSLKAYRSPYPFDFNNNEIEEENRKRIKKLNATL
jgi:hypothetical protein